MADTFLFRNNAVSTLLSPINDTDTTIFLQTGEGALFPSPTAGQRFAATLTDGAGNIEIVYCTAQSLADELTVTRGMEGTTARSWIAGDSITMRITQGILEQILQGDMVVLADSNADKVDGFDASATAGPNVLLALDGASILQATVANALLLQGNSSAYHLARGNHTGQLPSSALPSNLSTAWMGFPQSTAIFTTPSNISYFTMTLYSGGGGGGGGGAAFTYGGGGGGGGKRDTSTFNVEAIPGEEIVFTYGLGGSAGIAANASAGSPGGTGGYTQAQGNIIAATTMKPGQAYVIETIGSTNFTNHGASSNTIGTYFICTSVGTGDGTAKRTWRGGTGTGGTGGGYGTNGIYDGEDGKIGVAGLVIDDQPGQETPSGGAGRTGSNGVGSSGQSAITDYGNDIHAAGGGGGGGGRGYPNRGGFGGFGGSGFAIIEY